MNLKQCSKSGCQEFKFSGEFYKGSARCKECDKKRVAKWRKDNPGKVYSYNRSEKRKKSSEKYSLKTKY